MMRKLFLGSVAIIASLFMAGNVMAAGQTGQDLSAIFSVNATVIPVCSLTSVSLIGFGNYDGNVAKVVNDEVQVTCSLGAPYFIDMSAGIHSALCSTARCLAQGTDFLKYTIIGTGGEFKADGGGACVAGEWADGLGGSCHVEDTGTGVSAAQHNFTATVPAAQNITALGGYSDSVTVTLNF